MNDRRSYIEFVVDGFGELEIDNEMYELAKKGSEKLGIPVEKLITEAVQELIDKITEKN